MAIDFQETKIDFKPDRTTTTIDFKPDETIDFKPDSDIDFQPDKPSILKTITKEAEEISPWKTIAIPGYGLKKGLEVAGKFFGGVQRAIAEPEKETGTLPEMYQKAFIKGFESPEETVGLGGKEFAEHYPKLPWWASGGLGTLEELALGKVLFGKIGAGGEKVEPWRVTPKGKVVKPFLTKHPFDIIRERQLANYRASLKGPSSKYAGSLLLEKFPEDTRPFLKQAVNELPDDLAVQRRGVQTLESISNRAQELKGTVNIKALQPGDILNAEKNMAARLQVVDRAREVAKTGEGIMDLYDDIIRLNGLSTEAGRALSAHRIPLFSQADDEIRGLYDLIRQIDPSNTKELQKFFKYVGNPTFWDKLIEVRGSMLLTSPHTIERATSGNIQGRISQTLEITPSSIWNIIETNIRNIGRKIVGKPAIKREVYFREVFSDVYGAIRAIPKASIKAVNALLHEEYMTQSRAAETMARRGFAIKGKLGQVLRLGYRGVTAVDEFCHTISKEASFYRQATKQALREGARGIINIARRTSELAHSPTPEMIMQATDDALYETMRIPLGTMGKAFGRWLNMKGNIFKLQMAFLRTPVNLWKHAFQRSPLGVLSPKNWADLTASPELRAKAVGRLVTGQIISAGVVHHVLGGNITGILSLDKNKRQAMIRQGIQPYSIKIGDKYYSYVWFQPYGTLVGAIASATEIYKEKEETPPNEYFAEIAGTVAKMITNQSFMIGIKDTLRAFEDPSKYGSRLMQNFTSSLVVPRGVSYATRMLDPTWRDPENIWEGIKRQLPFLSKGVEPRLDVWGKPTEEETPTWMRALIPTRITKEKPDPIEQELVRLEIPVTPTPKSIEGISLTPEERNFITKHTGPQIYDRIHAFINHPLYPSLPDRIKKTEIQRIFTDERTPYREEMLLRKLEEKYNKMSQQEIKQDLKDKFDKKKISLKILNYLMNEYKIGQPSNSSVRETTKTVPTEHITKSQIRDKQERIRYIRQKIKTLNAEREKGNITEQEFKRKGEIYTEQLRAIIRRKP